MHQVNKFGIVWLRGQGFSNQCHDGHSLWMQIQSDDPLNTAQFFHVQTYMNVDST